MTCMLHSYGAPVRQEGGHGMCGIGCKKMYRRGVALKSRRTGVSDVVQSADDARIIASSESMSVVALSGTFHI